MNSEKIPYLSEAEIERLALLIEEASEVQQIACKILRHGYESCHPNGGESNREGLNREIGDLRHAIDLMTNARDLNGTSIRHYRDVKAQHVAQYLHHQPAGGNDDR